MGRNPLDNPPLCLRTTFVKSTSFRRPLQAWEAARVSETFVFDTGLECLMKATELRLMGILGSSPKPHSRKCHRASIRNSSEIHHGVLSCDSKRSKPLAGKPVEHKVSEEGAMPQLPYTYIAGFVPPLLVGIAAITKAGTSGMSMPLLGFAGIVAVAGLAGGLTNAYIINHRSLLSNEEAEEAGAPKTREDTKKAQMSYVGSYVGNGVLGAVAACVSWLAYGSYSNVDLLRSTGILTGVSLATAFFIGLAGPKWLQSEKDKGKWQAAAQDAARAKPEKNPELATMLSKASSDEAPRIAREAAKKG
jgi:hypothetical protein